MQITRCPPRRARGYSDVNSPNHMESLFQDLENVCLAIDSQGLMCSRGSDAAKDFENRRISSRVRGKHV
jgi:hypothetical protein